jgi:3-deoxy-D-manno-octulosonate 8-phosphate phosphatase KdsC-like HAD superfamily phosphatase
MARRFWDDDDARHRHRRALDVLGAALAADQPYRAADLAIDYREDVEPLAASEVDRIVALLERAGAQAKVSSIHVNGWFGDHDKRAMSKKLLSEAFGVDLEQERDAVLFVGDSPNDEPMFEFFPHSVAVANIERFLPQIAAKPAYLTEREAGAGFVELAEALLDAKSNDTRQRKRVRASGGKMP